MSTVQTDEEVETAEAADGGPASFRIPIPRYTVILLTAIGIVFAVQLYVETDRPASITGLFFHELRTSILSAGFIKPAFLQGGEYWLILTGAFLHGFTAHAAMNAYAFYSFGKLFELLTNRAHLAIVFLMSAVSGGLLSAYFLPDGISVGASGGIVGLIGYLLVYAFKRRQFVSAEFRKSLILNIGFILLFGFVLYGIVDNWGHIGGLLAGIVYGLAQISSDEYRNPQDAGLFVRAAGVATLAISIASALLAILLMLRSAPPVT